MEAQQEVMEQRENLAVGPGGQQAADQEKVPVLAEGGEEAQAPLAKAAGPRGAGMEAQQEVMEQLENLAWAADQEMVPVPEEGSGEAQAPPPPAAGPRRSPPPAWPRAAAAAVSSSDSDSDTDSDSSSSTLFSSSSAVSDEDDYPNEQNNRSYCIRTKDEVPIDKLPPVEDLSIVIPDNVELTHFGTVSSIIEQLVIIESLRGLPPVNEESIIFKENRQAAGKIFEIFGPVSHPFYVIRFNSSEHIKEKGINVQDSMYFAPSVKDFTQYIFAEKLKQEKGSDASWKNDQEPPSEVLDFSDDEKEREAKQNKKLQSQGRKKVRSETFPSSENKNLHQSVQQPASSYSRGYRGRGLSWDLFPPPSGENKGLHQPVQQPASSYSRGYRGRGFSWDLFPPPSSPQGFFRPTVRPPQLYSSDRRMYQESPMFPPPQRREVPMAQQYASPPPDLGYISDGHQFPPPPPNTHMMWTGPNMYKSSYSLLPPPPPPPTPPPESHPPQFKPY